MSTSSLTFFVSLLGFFIPFFSVSAGIITSPHKYAWSDHSGYINFEQVTVSDKMLAGYAWSANDGWIAFQTAQVGVSNDGTGHLSGYAWGERLGWVHFQNVQIDSNGRFSGSATGTLMGTLTFDCPNFCDVQTDWRPLSGGGGGGTPPGIPDQTTPAPFDEQPSEEPTPVIRDQITSDQAKRIDIIKDGHLNILDFNAMMVHWGERGSGQPADMNGDGVVDIFDFNLLMVYWGVTYL